MIRRSYRQHKTQWLNWLAEPIYWRDSVYDGGKRCVVIESFCTEGLLPFVQRYGYTWSLNPHDLTNKLLNLLFVMYQGKELIFRDEQSGWDPEHFHQFTHLMDNEVWAQFWEQWNGYADFDEFGYANKLQSSLYLFVWNQLNLELSPTVIQREQELIMEEDDPMNNVTKGKDDPYLQDTTLGYQDRHQHS